MARLLGAEMNSLLWRAGTACVPLFVWTTTCFATPAVQGRWEGEVRIPGAPQILVVDLLRVGPSKWTGSVILPGLDIKGAQLSDISVTDAAITGTVMGALRVGDVAPARIHLHLTAAGDLKGEFELAGNSSDVVLQRTGDPQVEVAAKSTAVAGGLEGAWNGRFELGGYARDVSLTLSNHAESAATAELTIVGKRTTQIPVDRVTQDAQFLKIESEQMAVTFEGRWSAQSGEIQGSIQMGSIEVPLVLHHGASIVGAKS
jgi:hypothetical protein